MISDLPNHDNLVARLRHWADDRPLDVPFRFLVDGVEESTTVTFAELHQRACGIAAHLQSLQMSGERALLLYPPGLDFIAGLFGCFYAGAIAVPVYPPRRNRNMLRIQAIAHDAQAKVALTVGDVFDRLDWLSQESPILKGLSWVATDRLRSNAHTEWKTFEPKGDGVAVLQYTSGSTGSPKGVILHHSNILHNHKLITQAFRASRGALSMSWLPAYHDMGLVGGILANCLSGESTVLMSPMAFLQKPVRWLQAITKYSIKISGGPNFAYDLCSKKIHESELADLDLSSWELAFNGAEPVRASTLDRFRRKFGRCGFRTEAFYPCYGMAESTLLITGGHPKVRAPEMAFSATELAARRVKALSADSLDARILVGNGQRLSEEEILIVDPDTHQPLPEDCVGEIWVNSPSVGGGYYNNPGATAQTFQARPKNYDGKKRFLRTGDLGFFYRNELFVTGRLKDLIIIRGVNHYPQDIELTVERSNERVRSGTAAAFAVEGNGGEQLVVVCAVERLAINDWNTVIGSIRRNVSAHHNLAPDAVILVRSGSIPKTSSGKIQRHACRDQFLEGSLVSLAEYFADDDPAPIRDNRRSSTPPHEPSPLADAQAGTVYGSTDPHDEATVSSNSQSDQAHGELAVVYEKVRAVAKERAGTLQPNTNIVELGLDSLERIEIANLICDHYGATFPEEVLAEIETCQQVADAARIYLVSTEGNGHPARAPECHGFDQMPEYKRLHASRKLLMDANLSNPFFRPHDGVARDTTSIDGKTLINFCSYNYLGMSGDPVVSKAAADAIRQYGTSVSASRLVSGERPIHTELEDEIADFLGVEDAVVFVGGHATNETTIGHLAGAGDLVLHDALAHNSIVQGAVLSGAERRSFQHNDWKSLDGILHEIRPKFRRVLIVIEGTYSMDGDVPDLAAFVGVKNRHDAFLMVDEAHSLGTLGATGRGISEHAGIAATEVDIWMGTLSKSLGSCGGYIAGEKALIEILKFTAPGFVFSVGLSPPNAAAALASLRLLRQQPNRVTDLQARSELFLRLADERRLETGTSKLTPIIPLILGNSKLALQLSAALYRRGINVQPIMYPAVEEEAARLRFFVTSCHTTEQIRSTVETTAQELAALQQPRSPTLQTAQHQVHR